MPHFPDEHRLIQRLWSLVHDFADDDLRGEYENWTAWHFATHQTEGHDPDSVTTYDLIQSLKMFCPCGEDDGAWLTRFEANLIIDKLKALPTEVG